MSRTEDSERTPAPVNAAGQEHLHEGPVIVERRHQPPRCIGKEGWSAPEALIGPVEQGQGPRVRIGMVRGREAGQLAGGHAEPGVTHAQWIEHTTLQKALERLARSSLHQHPEDVRPGVVEPALPRLMHERQGAQALDPCVGGERRGRPRRSERAQLQVFLGSLDGIGAWWCHHGSEPQPEGQEVLDRDGTVRRHRVVELGVETPQDPSVGQFGQQVLDRVLQLHDAVVDEHHGSHRRHRLTERRDPEDVVTPERFGVPECLRADDLHVHVAVVGHQRDEPGHRGALHVRCHYLVQARHAVLREPVVGHARQCAIAAF